MPSKGEKYEAKRKLALELAAEGKPLTPKQQHLVELTKAKQERRKELYRERHEQGLTADQQVSQALQKWKANEKLTAHEQRLLTQYDAKREKQRLKDIIRSTVRSEAIAKVKKGHSLTKEEQTQYEQYSKSAPSRERSTTKRNQFLSEAIADRHEGKTLTDEQKLTLKKYDNRQAQKKGKTTIENDSTSESEQSGSEIVQKLRQHSLGFFQTSSNEEKNNDLTTQSAQSCEWKRDIKGQVFCWRLTDKNKTGSDNSPTATNTSPI